MHTLQLCIDEGWGLWTGGVGSKNIAVLVAVVTGGFHSAAKYYWAVDNVPDEEEVYPILYASSIGEYTCSIAMSTLGVSFKATFSVTSGKLLDYYSHCSLKFTLLHVFIGSGDNWEVKVPPNTQMVGTGKKNAQHSCTFDIAVQRLSNMLPLLDNGMVEYYSKNVILHVLKINNRSKRTNIN